MSNIDKRGLREAAEKATKGRWAVEFDDEIYSTDGVNHGTADSGCRGGQL